jgi:D-alanine-D-alanine ligase
VSRRLKVALIFGGSSVEHEVSLTSARSVLAAIDRSRYEVLPIAVAPDGRWLGGPRALKALESGGDAPLEGDPCTLMADPGAGGIVALEGAARGGAAGSAAAAQPVDVVFPLIHGRHGEDGCLQGLLEMSGIPYVGCGVLASAAGMDKEVCKRLLAHAGLPVVEYLCLRDGEWARNWPAAERAVARGPGFPCFVKPANGGSSVGIVKVAAASALRAAIEEAARYDRKVLVERAVPAREIEVSVLGNEDPQASVAGEIEPSNEFYDYDAKYVDNRSRLHIPAHLTPPQADEARRLALAAFRAIEGEGMARVDFLLDRGDGRLYLNEINTIPGFTPISMYPKLWEASGLPYTGLIDRLIGLALERHQRRARLETRYGARRIPAP